jgi:hypothetical protein
VWTRRDGSEPNQFALSRGEASFAVFVQEWDDDRAGDLADASAAYDNACSCAVLARRGSLPIICNGSPCKHAHSFDRAASRVGNAIGRSFRRLKDRRRIPTGYDKLANTVASAVANIC